MGKPQPIPTEGCNFCQTFLFRALGGARVGASLERKSSVGDPSRGSSGKVAPTRKEPA